MVNTVVRQIKEFMESLSDAKAANYQISQKILNKHGYVHDVVTPLDHRTCCFTKGYTHYVKGTGYILQTLGVVGKDPMTIKNTWYFTLCKVANLMGFPAEFSFSDITSNRQQY
ncbi:tRNA (cytosine-5-)-methyltransferase [Coemansia sp. RSA 1199]|nr:tRNA (cytosine-5-)-methyltransferase [Coemansia sp. RSA 1199]